MKIEEIITSLSGEDVEGIGAQIQALKQRNTNAPNMEEISKQWNPKGHDIWDKAKRPDKTVKRDVGGETVSTTESVARIALALQKLIVKRAASFLFGNEVIINSSKLNLSDQEEKALEVLKKILSKNKEKSHNKRLARELFKCTEVAEVWYPVESSKEDRYGFESDIKIRCQIFTPDNEHLFPIFDDTGDMIAFSREYIKKEDSKEVTYFETYTSDEKVVWKQDGKDWEVVERKDNPIKKIPIVYARQNQTEWEDVQSIIDRLEKLLSNYSDTIDYHASPTIFVQGEIVGFSKKGEAGKIIEGKNEAKAEYLSWDQAPDAVKLEIENDLRMIFSLTQTPDISFESVKGIGAISGIALKLLFLDAHLKVEDKKEIFDDFLTRRYNILKAYIGEMNNGMKKAANSLDLEPEITPYMINDEQSLMEMLVSGSGGKAIISRKTAVKTLGWVDDIDEELKEIKNEEVGGFEQ